MGALRCVDGSVLSVEAVDCRDKAGQPYEITLRLARDSVPFAAVGQRCGYQLSQLAERISAARLDPGLAAEWPDPDDRFPAHPAGCVPGEHEYFALRSRDRADLPGERDPRDPQALPCQGLDPCAPVVGQLQRRLRSIVPG